MTAELAIVGWLIVLAIVQVMAPAIARTAQYGVKWNASARDADMPAPNKYAARLARAQANLFETLPLFIGAVLVVHVAGLSSGLTLLACQLYLGARIAHVLLYVFGVPYLRGAAFGVALVALIILVYVILTAPL
jgi:uncharacterized MAPEG superfamily protein